MSLINSSKMSRIRNNKGDLFHVAIFLNILLLYRVLHIFWPGDKGHFFQSVLVLAAIIEDTNLHYLPYLKEPDFSGRKLLFQIFKSHWTDKKSLKKSWIKLTIHEYHNHECNIFFCKSLFHSHTGCPKNNCIFLKSNCTMGQDIITVSVSISRIHSETQRKTILSPFAMLRMNFKSAIFGPLPENE